MVTIRNTDDTVAVSVIVGFLLAFTILTIAAAQYQVNVVPEQELQTEVEHSVAVGQQMSQLRAGVIGASNSGFRKSNELKLGTQYNDILIFGLFPTIHPPDPTGRITVKQADRQIRVLNASNEQEADNYWNGIGQPCGSTPQCYDTAFIRYEPDYVRYQPAPNRAYENTVLYREFRDTDEKVFDTNQSLVDGRNINLYTVDGDVDTASTQSTNVEVRPISAPAESVTLRSNTTSADHPVTIEVPTRLNQTEWEQLLQDERASEPGGYVQNIEVNNNLLTVTLATDETYNFKISRVQLSTSRDRTPVKRTKPAYIAWRGTDEVNIEEGSRQTIRAQVRDKYNNGVSGVAVEAVANFSNDDCAGEFVNAQRGGGNCGMPGTLVSGSDGQVSFVYEAPEVSEDRDISIQLRIAPGEDTVRRDRIEKPTETTAALLSHRSTLVDSELSGTINDGNLKDDDRLRVLDFRYSRPRITKGTPIMSQVITDNTGITNKSVTSMRPTDLGGNPFRVTDYSENIKITPAQRQRHEQEYTFEQTGLYQLQLGTATANISVVPETNALIKARIKDNEQSGNIEDVPPDLFKDGDGDGGTEFRETKNIPPIEEQGAAVTDTSQGDLQTFQQMRRDNPESASFSIASAPPKIGIATENVPESKQQEVFVRYTADPSSVNSLEMNVVNARGNVIDQNTTYLLNTTGRDRQYQRYFVFSKKESRFAQTQGEIFLVYENTNPEGTPEIDFEYQKTQTGPQIPLRSETNFTVSDVTIQDKPITVGEPTIVEATIQNTGSAGGIYTIQLTQSGAGQPGTIINQKQIVLNPKQTRTMTLEAYVYETGDVTFSVEDESDSATVNP